MALFDEAQYLQGDLKTLLERVEALEEVMQNVVTYGVVEENTPEAPGQPGLFDVS